MSQLGGQGLPAAHTDAAWKVGYRKPPEAHRFRKGVSGNPRGRPRKTSADAGDPLTDYHNLVLKEADRPIKVNENGRTRTISVMQGVLRVLAGHALKGNVRAAEVLAKEVRSAEQSTRREHRRRFERQVDYKQRWVKEIQRCDEAGYERPDPVPHPADMVVDSLREVVIIHGPADDVQKAQWDEREAEKQEVRRFIEQLQAVLAGPKKGLKPYGGSRQLVSNLITNAEQHLAALDAAYPSEKQRRQPGNAIAQHGTRNRETRAAYVLPPAIGAVEAARDYRGPSIRDLSSSLEQAEAMADELSKQFAVRDDAAGRVSAEPSRKFERPDCREIHVEREALRKRIAFLEEQVNGSEEELDLEFESHLDAAFLLEETKRKLFDLDDPKHWQ